MYIENMQSSRTFLNCFQNILQCLSQHFTRVKRNGITEREKKKNVEISNVLKSDISAWDGQIPFLVNRNKLMYIITVNIKTKI